MADYLYGINPIQAALHGQGRPAKELMVSSESQSPRLTRLIGMARSQHLEVRFCPRRELDRLCGHPHHQGVLLRVAPFAYADFEDLLADWQQSGERAFFLLLDGVTDPHNLGAILRTAAVAGCQGVIVPKDRSCPVTPVVEKAASGALSELTLCQVTNLARTIEVLKKAQVWCYGLAGEEGAQNLFDSDLRGDLALVIGSEGKGLRPNVRKHCDALLAIPMQGGVGSLNASVAAGIVLFEVVRQSGGDDLGR